MERKRTNGRRRALILLGAATFLFWAALYLYVPIIPSYAESQGASLSMVGLVVASYAIAQLLLRAPIGVWADFLGKRKPFVVAGLLFTSLGAVAMGLAPGPWLLFGGRTFTGVAAATWVTSSVLFASYFPPERAARGIGVISFINSAAIVTATSVGGQLAEAWGPESAFFIAAPLGALGALLLIPLAEPPVTRARAFSYDTFLRVVAHPVVLTASALSILMHFASTATIFSFTLVYADRLGASSSDLGLISGAYLGSSTLATLGAVYLIERRGYSFTILLGGVVMGVSLLATPLFTALPPFVGLQIAIGAGSGLASTALMALSITAVPPAHRAMAMGAYQAIYSLGMLTGPILGGVLAEGPGLESVFYMAGSAALLAGALAFARKLPRR